MPAPSPVGELPDRIFRSKESGPPTSYKWEVGDLVIDKDGVLHECEVGGNPGTWRSGASVLGVGIPVAFTTDRALCCKDNGKTFVCTGARTVTINTGLPTGFGCCFKGDISFAGTATVNDLRVPGVNQWCALVQIGVDTYDVVGSV